MSKTPLPPPPGFQRQKKVFGSSKRYVYPFSNSPLGEAVSLFHEDYLSEQREVWKTSKLRALAARYGRRAYKELHGDLKGLKSERAVKLGMTLLSFHHPQFVRRNPLDQVYEHLRHQPRHFMKLDIDDAFGCVYPGFNPKFLPKLQDWAQPDLFDHDGLEKYRWPFFHPEKGGLIQGAPSSSVIFDLACAQSGLDTLLRETARANDAVVSRYADDMVFSRLPYNDRPFGDRMYTTLRKRIEGMGFKVNDHKCRRRVDIKREPVEFLGVSVFRKKIKARPAFFERMSALGVITEGHMDWLQQIEDLKQLLQLTYNRRAGK